MQTVIFDVDGTLADTAILTMAAFRRVTPRVGLPMPDLATVRAAIGYANPEFYDRIFPTAPRELVRLAGKQVEAEELALLADLEEDLLFPGCRDLLTALRNRAVRLYIASTGSHKHVDAVVDKTDIRPLFEAIYCGEPDKVNMIRRIIADGNKSDFIMVGDMEKDCQGAHANGIRAAGVCYGYCLRQTAKFDFFLDTPMELLDLL